MATYDCSTMLAELATPQIQYQPLPPPQFGFLDYAETVEQMRAAIFAAVGIPASLLNAEPPNYASTLTRQGE